MLKFVIIGTAATLAFAGVARAADLPHPQPVYSEAPVGKAPIGKGPIGKGPIGKGLRLARLRLRSSTKG